MTGKGRDEFSLGGVLASEGLARTGFIIFKFKAWGDGAAEQGKAAAGDQVCSLPDVLRNYQLKGVTA